MVYQNYHEVNWMSTVIRPESFLLVRKAAASVLIVGQVY